MSESIYRFRVKNQDTPTLDFILHIFVQQNQPPKYFDLLYKIKQYSKYEKDSMLDLNRYYMIIEKGNTHKFEFKDDIGLRHAFHSIKEQDSLEIKLLKKNNTADAKNLHLSDTLMPIVKPIFTRADNSDEQVMLAKRSPITRKDSGVFFEQDLSELKECKSRKLPTLSNIVTSNLDSWASNGLPSPPQSTTRPNIKLPGLSSLIISPLLSPPSSISLITQNQQNLAPIYNTSPVHRDHSPLTPPPSAYTSKGMKRSPRGGASGQSQFICEHVIDPATGKTCCQVFRRSYDLSRHQTIHLKNRPLCYCYECGKKFTRLDALRRHERIQGHSNKYNTYSSRIHSK